MILKDKVIIIMGISKFDGPIESTSYTTAKFFARDNNVFYVDYPYTWKDYLGKKNETFAKRKALFSRKSNGILATEIPRLKIIIVPPLLSINFLKESSVYRFLLSINEKIIASRITKAVGTQNVQNAVYINSFNFHYPNLSTLLSPSLSVYHCVDPLVFWHDRKHGLVSERLVVKNSNLVICTSRQLFEEKKLINPSTYFIPNAADVSHSFKAMDPNLIVNDKIRSIRKPIIGYFGNIERRIDYKLLIEVICANPEMSFVFAGPVQEAFVPEDFRKLKNIYFLGRIPYSQMPSVIKAFNVSLIPFKKDEVSNTIFPLKLFEYLGAGKPVVATDFNIDLKEFTFDEVQYCGSAQEFSAAIREAISNDCDANRQKRVAIAAENSWDKRLGELKLLIEQFYRGS